MASRAHIGWTWTWAERASWFGKSGVGAINWQGSFGTPSAGYSKRGSRENIVCAGENSYKHWIYFVMSCKSYPIKRVLMICDAHYLLIAT